MSLGTAFLTLHTKHNSHEQWDKRNQKKRKTWHVKQLLLHLNNQVKHHGPLGSISSKRHLRSLKRKENVGKELEQKGCETATCNQACRDADKTLVKSHGRSASKKDCTSTTG